MPEILREEYLKVLASIYYYLVKRREADIEIDSILDELGIERDTLADDVKYLINERYIEGQILLGNPSTRIADFRVHGLTNNGRNIIENPFNFSNINSISNFNTNIINAGSITGSVLNQTNVSNISSENINIIEKQIDSLVELVSEEQLKNEIEDSREDLKKGNFGAFKEKIRRFYNDATRAIDGLQKFATLVLTIASIARSIPH